MTTDILRLERLRIFTRRSLAQQAAARHADPVSVQTGIVQIDQDRACRAYRRIAQYI